MILKIFVPVASLCLRVIRLEHRCVHKGYTHNLITICWEFKWKKLLKDLCVCLMCVPQGACHTCVGAMCVGAACMVWVPRVWLPSPARRGCHIMWNWSSRQLWATPELWYSTGAVSALNCWAISPHGCNFYFQTQTAATQNRPDKDRTEQRFGLGFSSDGSLWDTARSYVAQMCTGYLVPNWSGDLSAVFILSPWECFVTPFC